jgi:hypothetical protein
MHMRVLAHIRQGPYVVEGAAGTAAGSQNDGIRTNVAGPVEGGEPGEEYVVHILPMDLEHSLRSKTEIYRRSGPILITVRDSSCSSKVDFRHVCLGRSQGSQLDAERISNTSAMRVSGYGMTRPSRCLENTPRSSGALVLEVIAQRS